jgi:hypothetical protein
MIDRDGNVFGYASGQLSKDMMQSIINQTLKGERLTIWIKTGQEEIGLEEETEASVMVL